MILNILWHRLDQWLSRILRSELELETIIAAGVQLLEVVAQAACLGADSGHRCHVLVTLAILSPGLAARILVDADLLAYAACIGARIVHVCWVFHALVIECPDLAFSSVFVLTACFAALQTARDRACLQGVAGVIYAFARCSPSWAVVRGIFAHTRADSARNSAMHLHKDRV